MTNNTKEKRKPLTTDLAIKNAKCESGKRVTRYSCGGLGLYLDVKPGGARSFMLCVMIKGKRIERGLGSYPQVTLAQAKEKAVVFTRQLREGQEVGTRKLQQAIDLSGVVTFREAARRYLAKQDADKAFKPAMDGGPSVHRKQWDYTLEKFVFPKIGDMDVDDIRISHLSPIFDPIWRTMYGTASKTRQRVASVIDYAVEQGWRDEDRSNPARHKSDSYKKPKNYQTRHHPSIPPEEMPIFMRELRALEYVSAWAVEFTILTGVRTTETRAAKWDEIDFDAKMWTIPAERMKAAKAHRVPLSDRAIAVLQKLLPLRGPDNWIFPGNGGCLSNMAQLACLKGLRPDATVHGFRSTFRSWAISVGVVDEVRAACSAHAQNDKVKAAYERGDFFDQRVPVMQAWADYLADSGYNQTD